jgi:hypothetical protein
VKHTSEWKFVRKNSKGEAILRRDTNESLDDVLEYLKDKNVAVEVHPKATLLSIYVGSRRFDYFWTTGRWSQRRDGHPKKHYHSKGIADFFDRFLSQHVEEADEQQKGLVVYKPIDFYNHVC